MKTLSTLSRLSALFLVFYAGWQAMASWVHGLAQPPDPARLNPWIRAYAKEFDGLEVPVMSVLFTMYLTATAWLVLREDRMPGFRSRAVRIACCLMPLAVLLATRSWAFSPLPMADIRGWGLVAAGLGLAGVLVWACSRMPRLALPAWCGLAAFMVFSAAPPSVFDYGYLLGPAARILEGEPLGGSFQQYGLGQTLLFAGLMSLRLSLGEMQAVMALVFAFWILLYARLAFHLFADRRLAWLFLFALVLVRFAAFKYYPMNVPQTSPMRLDLWVPLALAWARWGGASPLTAAAFGAAYLIDNLFGALLCGAYLGAVGAGVAFRIGEFAGLKPGRAVLLVLPAAAACAFQSVVYGAVFSPAGSLYQSLRLGFLPISRRSLFFPVAFVLSLALGVLARERKPLPLFLFVISVIHLLYFFGRSHENNLLNISGILLFIAFLALDRIAVASGRAAPARLAACLLIAASAFAFSEGIADRIRHAGANLAARRWVERAPEESAADALEAVVRRNRNRRILFVSPYDAYLGYRFGIRSTGFWTPFPSRFDRDETSAYLRDRLKAGDLALLVGWDESVAADLAASPIWAASGGRLGLVREDGVAILTWIPVSLEGKGVHGHPPR